MHLYQRQFIEFALQHKALDFGDFTLKSGRKSPYFFNICVFHDGYALAKLGEFYAKAIQNSKITFDVLFGPAYKGIPLACATAIALANLVNKPVQYAFNRKEIKNYGEGGQIVGAPLKGRILIIDDVITAGTAVHESMQLIKQANAQLAGIVIALDRQERGQKNISAIQEIENITNAPVISIISLSHLLEYLLEQKEMSETLKKIYAYQEEYGIKV
jgi:orotate phosphoribosyltransferase